MHRYNFTWPKRVRHFTWQEVEATGAALSGVQARTIYLLDDWRHDIGRTVLLLFNGITTGQHASPYHPAGKAVDICFRETDGPVDIVRYVMAALRCGFTGVGVYWNGTCYSMHLDWGATLRQWARWRSHGELDWHETGLVQDPRLLQLAA